MPEAVPPGRASPLPRSAAALIEGRTTPPEWGFLCYYGVPVGKDLPGFRPFGMPPPNGRRFGSVSARADHHTLGDLRNHVLGRDLLQKRQLVRLARGKYFV